MWASKLLGHRVVGYVEWEPYCQRIIAQRIEDGLFDRAPIFGDIRAFIHKRTGWAQGYRGRVDVITAGFPCQPFSVAGRRKGQDDSRNMWPQTRRTIGIVRPRYVLLENVPGLVAHSYFGRILGDLATLGYNEEWDVLGADDVGAPHRRKRLWKLAYSDEGRRERSREGRVGQSDTHASHREEPCGCGALADADSTRRERQRTRTERGRKEKPRVSVGGCQWWDEDPADVADTDSDDKHGRSGDVQVGRKRCAEEAQGDMSGRNEQGAQSRVGRVAHGLAHRSDRLKALGNGQISQVAALAWRVLRGRE